jgi:hypothetical protein
VFVPVMALVILASVPLAGGRLSALAGIRLRGAKLIFLALALQILMTVIASAPRPILVGLHLVTYLMAAVVLWRNRRLPGLVAIGLGSMLNGGVIFLNGGTLPASATALARAGEKQNPANFANSGALPHPVLARLGDVLATPSWLPFRNVISVGDVIILVGTAILVHAVCYSWLNPRRWRRTPESLPA